MQDKSEIWLETIHGRKNKCKSQFKAALNKVLISGLVLTTILSTGAMAVPAYAAEVTPQKTYTMEYGVSVEQAMKDIRNTVAYIQQNIKNGSIVSSSLENLAKQIYSLESAVKAQGGEVSQDVKALLDEVETFASTVKTAKSMNVTLAVASVKANLGLDMVTANQSQSSNSSSNTSATQSTIKFTDVPENAWYYKYVMDCANKGLVSGVGDNQFNPNGVMSRAQFFTVIVRYLYPDAVKSYQGPSAHWWDAYYNIAVEKGLITVEEFRNDETISQGMSRQEMALVISRALETKGQAPEVLVNSSKIADYNSIGTYYRTAVRTTYTAGIISGVDSKGTFKPQGTLTRAEACTVLVRLTNYTPTGNTQTETPIQTPTNKDDGRFDTGAQHQEFREGEVHTEPHVGDVVIKADGTRVTLEATKIGTRMVLGWGANGPQGVDPYSGCGNGVYQVGGLSWWDHSTLIKDPTTGSVFSQKEWLQIRKEFKPTYEGKEGEIGGLNNWYECDEDGMWLWRGPAL